MNGRTLTLLAGLAGAAGLFAWSRSRSGGAAVSSGVGDVLEFVDVNIVAGLTKPRGYRNNNPGNVRYIVRDPWNGQIRDDGGYGVYSSPALGTRALGKELLKRRAQGFRTVREILAGKPDANGIRRGGWAPPNENDTAAYVKALAMFLGVNADTPIDIEARLPDLARGIAKHENGYIDESYSWSQWVRMP